ncbi:hypothetical protein JAAARDRAFT_197264 [Jaapia argillacea MUCL 33604]|uniref:Uncharacterized protein n=1 Tax=Jaapia argillacea MUCL 33604 TaxID=933084 RepID=A0A067PSZ4_9AGAM|nr:hypothetical protein JAAARDRAFT_197264 [Jaapia argillacea MUCL 33604]
MATYEDIYSTHSIPSPQFRTGVDIPANHSYSSFLEEPPDFGNMMRHSASSHHSRASTSNHIDLPLAVLQARNRGNTFNTPLIQPPSACLHSSRQEAPSHSRIATHCHPRMASRPNGTVVESRPLRRSKLSADTPVPSPEQSKHSTHRITSLVPSTK